MVINYSSTVVSKSDKNSDNLHWTEDEFPVTRFVPNGAFGVAPFIFLDKNFLTFIFMYSDKLG
jgi:hypothetical protein